MSAVPGGFWPRLLMNRFQFERTLTLVSGRFLRSSSRPQTQKGNKASAPTGEADEGVSSLLVPDA